MKKKILICVAVLFSILSVVWGLKIHDTYKKYTIPKEIHYSYGEGVEYKGLEYKLKSIEMYDMEELIKNCDLENMRESLTEMEQINGERKYFVVTFDVTAVDEDNSLNLQSIAFFNDYYAGTAEGNLDISFNLNGKSYGLSGMEVGETKEYYVVFSLMKEYYTDETFKALGVDDIQVLISDVENGSAYYFDKE